MSNYNLFAYGTLMVPEVMIKIIGNLPPSQPGTLHDYDCFRLKNQAYPGMVFRTGAITCGIIYLDLDEVIIKKLDIFEGDLYNRVSVTVSTESGNPIRSFAYVLKPGAEKHLSSQRWSREEFEKQHLQYFLAEDSGFRETSRTGCL